MTATPSPAPAADDGLTYAVDMSNGEDETAVSILNGRKVYSFVGEQAEVILALIHAEADRLAGERIEAIRQQLPKPLRANSPVDGTLSDDYIEGHTDVLRLVDSLLSEERGRNETR